MSDQLAIDGTGIPTQPDLKLTKRQRYALELIGRVGPISSEDLGCALHVRRDAHSGARTCMYCKPEGAGMGARLRELGLVRMRREKGWYVPGEETVQVVPPDAYDPSSAEIPY